MAKYRVDKKCFGFKGALYEEGQIVILGDHEKPPVHFKRLDSPKAAVPVAPKPSAQAPKPVVEGADPFGVEAARAAVKASEGKLVDLRKQSKAAAKAKDKAKVAEIAELVTAAEQELAKAKEDAVVAFDKAEAAKDAAKAAAGAEGASGEEKIPDDPGA